MGPARVSGNYRSGADFERRAKAELVARGALVVRAAGSKGSIDLVALWHSGVPGPWLIQCKRDGKLSARAREELIVLARMYAATAFLCRSGARGQPPEFERL